MYKVGVFPGKFLPPHRGHLNSIINAATKCERLYVVVSDNSAATLRECNQYNLHLMDMHTRIKWLSMELRGFDHIKVIGLDESDIPEYPHGWDLWALELFETVPEKFDVIFGGEPEYMEQHSHNFPGVTYELYDYQRERYPICATEIRKNPIKHWDYILGSARPHFAKRILITGTESCGKTTITKYLGKIFHTSWTEEVGRYYAERFMGGYEGAYTYKDFEKIAMLQAMEDDKALRTCNKVVFFDTDAVVTQYYLGIYLNGGRSTLLERMYDPYKYDKVLMFYPDVPWVADGQRFLSDQDQRNSLHWKLDAMYRRAYFGDKIVHIEGDYSQRLRKAVEVVEDLLKEDS